MSGPPRFVANEVLAFVPEVLAIAALCWRVHLGPERGATVGARRLRPSGRGRAGGLFAAPRARHRASLPGVHVVEAPVLLGAAASLYGLGQHVLADVFAVLVIANTAVAEASRPRVAGR